MENQEKQSEFLQRIHEMANQAAGMQTENVDKRAFILIGVGCSDTGSDVKMSVMGTSKTLEPAIQALMDNDDMRKLIAFSGFKNILSRISKIEEEEEKTEGLVKDLVKEVFENKNKEK